MADICIYIKCEPHLKQWLINLHGGNNPVQLRKNSNEFDLLFCFLHRQPAGSKPKKGTADELAIVIPNFKDKPPQEFNYISPMGKKLLCNVFEKQFVENLWQDCQQFHNKFGMNKRDAIHAFMAAHGIDDTEDNWQAINKAYCKKRQAVLAINWYKKTHPSNKEDEDTW